MNEKTFRAQVGEGDLVALIGELIGSHKRQTPFFQIGIVADIRERSPGNPDHENNMYFDLRSCAIQLGRYDAAKTGAKSYNVSHIVSLKVLAKREDVPQAIHTFREKYKVE